MEPNKEHHEITTDQQQRIDSSVGQVLNSSRLMEKILYALKNVEPLSVISVGQTEAFVMAQYTLYPEHEFMKHREAYNANLGIRSGFMHRGIRFPNREARDAAVEAVRKADIVGYNIIENNARELTERVFAAYHIAPPLIFEANLRRVFMFSQQQKYQEMMAGKKILLVSSIAPEAKAVLDQTLKDALNFEIVGAVQIYDYEEISAVKQQIAGYSFDLCLLAAGVNATILAPYIAQTYGKVAFDIGWGMKSFITGEVVTDSFITDVIGLENLMKM